LKPSTTPSRTAAVRAHRRQAQDLDSQALDYLPDGIFTCQFLAGVLTVAYGNRAFKELLGLPPWEGLEGRELCSLIGGLLSTEVRDTLHRAVTVRQRLILMLPTHAQAGERRFRLELRPASENGGADWVGSLGLAETAAPLELTSAHFVRSGGARPAIQTATVDSDTRDILDAAPGLISLRSSDGRFGFVNSAMGEFVGLDDSDVLGRRWSDLVVGEEQCAALRLPTQKLLESGQPVVERDVALTDTLGRERHFDVTHRLVWIPPGTEHGDTRKQTLSVATERLELEGPDYRGELAPQELQETTVQLAQELDRARSELRDIAERMPGAIARWSIGEDRERLTFLSQGTELLTGHRSVDIMREPELLFSGTDRDSRAAFRHAVDKSRRNLSAFVLDFPIRHRKSDERRWLRLSAAARSVVNGEVLLHGVLTDVTAEKQQECTILAARNQLHTVAGVMPGVVYQVRFSLDGRERAYLFVGDGTQEIFGTESQECLRSGALFEDRVFEEDVKRVNESVELAVRTLSPWDVEFRVTDRGGNAKWVRVVATPGEAVGDSVVFSGVITDNTEPHRAEVRLAAAEVRLAQARRRLDDIRCVLPGALYRCEVAPDGTPSLTSLSQGAKRILGIDPDRLVADQGLTLGMIHREDRPALWRAFTGFIESMIDFEHEFRVRDAHGDIKWIRLTARPRAKARGRVVVNGYVSDITAERIAEQTLADIRTQMRHVTRTISGAVYQVAYSADLSARYVFMSEGWRELFGVEPELVKADSEALFKRIHPADRFSPIKKEALTHAIKNFEAYRVEFRLLDNGQERWIRASGRPVRKSGDEYIYVCVAHDVSDLKRASAALESSQRQLKDVTETIPGAVFKCIASDGLELSYISAGARELFGLEPDELTGSLKRLLAFRRDGRVGETLRRLSTLSRDLEPWQEEFEILTVDGDSRWLKVGAQAVKGLDGTTYYHGVITDTSDAKFAELRSADGEERLELALENGGLGLLDWSVASSRAIYNAGLAKILGYDYAELGTNINWLHDLEHPGDSSRKQKALQAHLNGETPDFNCEYRLRTKSDEWRWVSAQGRVVKRGDNGGALRYVGTIKDVTERIDDERRLEQQVIFSRLITKISSELMSVKPDEIDQALSESLRTIGQLAGAQQSYLCGDRDAGCMVVHSVGYDSANSQVRMERPGCASGGWTWLHAQAAARLFVQTPDVRELPDEASNEREDFLRRGVASFLMVPLFIGDQSLGWLGFEFKETGRCWDDGELSLFRVVGEIITQTVSRAHGARALEAAEAKVYEITQAVPGVVAQAYRSPAGRFKFHHLSGTGLSQATVDRALADPAVLLDRVDKRDRRELERSLARAAADLTSWQHDYRTRDKTGEVVWVAACAYPTRTPDGGTLFNGIATDVTDRKRAEEALQRSEERFRVLYESTPVMMHSTDARGRIVNVNREWLNALGHARTDVIGRRTEDFLTRASRTTLDSALKDLAVSSGEVVQDTACQMIRRDGEPIDVVLSVRAERAKSHLVGMSVSILNVTERNQAVRALEESEERYRAVVRGQTDAICRFDREGSIQFANEPCLRLLAGSAKPLEGGATWYEWIEPTQRERLKKRLQGLTPADSLAQLELRMVDVENRWYQWTIRGFFSEGGELSGYQAVGRDIQELKVLETEIREVSHREQERIGHDLHDGLGQELTGVSLMLKTLEQAIGTQAPALKPRVSALRDMVGQSIATTRALAQGLSPVHLERDGFAGALSQLAANMESVHGTPVRFSAVRGAAISDPSVATDLYRIAQEALNNAARHACARQIVVRLAIDKEALKLEITDDGRGVPVGVAETDGMGLKIMRYRASMIDASLDILPREGGGTVVRCTLQQQPEVRY